MPRSRLRRRSRWWAALALSVPLSLAARAEDTPPPAETVVAPLGKSSAPAEPKAATPAATEPMSGAGAQPAPEVPSTPAQTPPPPAVDTGDVPAQPPAQPPASTAAPEPQPAAAADNQIGRSIFVANEVEGKSGDAPAQRVQVNDDILFDEDIITGADSKTVVEFRDGSTFEIGPDAVVRIDAFIFNPEEGTSEKSLSVTRGVFRYVSGYVAGSQDTKIATATGTLGIRGSVASGIVDPETPDFLYVGDGVATFTNDAGSAELQPGNAIAVPSTNTPPMAPAEMPPAVAAQVLQVIEKRLPPREALQNRPPPSEAWLRRTGSANLVPIALQRERMAAFVHPRPRAAIVGRGALAGELGLLVEANRINLFRGRQAARSAEQTAFLGRIGRQNPNALTTIRRFNTDARAIHTAAMTTGTAFVLHGVGRVAPSAETMRRITAASVRANPGAAALINRHAAEGFQHRVNPGTNPPGEHKGFERKPLEHGLPGRNGNERKPLEHALPGRNEHKPVERNPLEHQERFVKKPPPKRKGDDRQDNR